MPSHAVPPNALTPRRIARFWLPLEATWLMMAVEGPFLAAVIARLPGPKENLAAFGIASALVWIVEAPIVMVLSAANALCRDHIAYNKLRRFFFSLNAVLTAIMLAMIAPPVFRFVSRGVMGVPQDVAALAGRALALLVLWPAAIGYRRFYQGILIRSGRPHAVTWGTVVRMSTMAATGLVAALVLRLPGASVGAAAMAAGVLAEAAASRLMARSCVRALRRQPNEACAFGASLTGRAIGRFYAPLALTSFLAFFINPLTSFFLARGRQPLESLAVLPVIMGLTFLFRTAGIALQEVVIALLGEDGENRDALFRFTRRVAVLSSLALGLVVATPLAGVWYRNVSGLSPELGAFAFVPGILLVCLPLLEAFQSYQRALLVREHRTRPISAAVAVHLAVTTVLFTLCIFVLRWPGAATIGLALSSGYAAGNVVLAAFRRRPAAGPSLLR